MTRLLAAALLISPLAACAGGGGVKKDTRYVARDVNTLYRAAQDRLERRQYRLAAALFDEVERQHPYSVWATKAQLMAAYANYQDNKYDEAIVGLDRFIQLNPSNRDVSYAYYLKGLSYYEQITDVQRDAKLTELALNSLDEVVRRFPESIYARDARLKIDLTYDHLAGKEMEVGRFYLTRGHYVGAINRFRTVVDKYQTTSHVPEALHRLTEAYLSLGLTQEAAKTAAVLGHNFPGSQWYADSYGLVQTGKLPPEDRPNILVRSFNWLF